MKDKTAFEEALRKKLQEMPIPDESTSWMAMKILLDKKEDPHAALLKKIIPLLSLLLLLGGLSAIIIMKRSGKVVSKPKPAAFFNQKKSPRTNENTDHAVQNSHQAEINALYRSGEKFKAADHTGIAATDVNKTKYNTMQEVSEDQPQEGKSTSIRKRRSYSGKYRMQIKTEAPPVEETRNNAKNLSSAATPSSAYVLIPNNKFIPDSKGENVYNKHKLASIKNRFDIHHSGLDTSDRSRTNIPGITFENEAPGNKKNSISLAEPGTKKMLSTGALAGDTAALKANRSDSLATADPQRKKNPAKEPVTGHKSAPENVSKKQKNAIRQLTWSAGLGLQQQIPLGKQRSYAYSFNGNKTVLNNYIPSVYVRAGKKSKWAAQFEFAYGSPQMCKPFSYSRKSVLDNNTKQLSVTSLQLDKLFYHQLTLSFNYYLNSRWSIGAGGVHNILYRTISAEHSLLKNTITGEEMMSTKLIAARNSNLFFYRSTNSLLLQGSFEYKRFCFLLRADADLNSFIKYTMPSGEIREQRNNALDFLVRYRIWRRG